MTLIQEVERLTTEARKRSVASANSGHPKVPFIRVRRNSTPASPEPGEKTDEQRTTDVYQKCRQREATQINRRAAQVENVSQAATQRTA